MIPRLNKLCDLYSQVSDAGGDSEVTLEKSNIPCRITLGEKLQKLPGGDYIQFDGWGHLPETPLLERNQIIRFEEKFYTIYNVNHTKDLNGNVLFQYVMLKINKNVEI